MDGMELYLVTITRVHAILIALSSCVCSSHLFYVYVSLICLRFVILGDKTDVGSVWWHWQGGTGRAGRRQRSRHGGRRLERWGGGEMAVRKKQGVARCGQTTRSCC